MILQSAFDKEVTTVIVYALFSVDQPLVSELKLRRAVWQSGVVYRFSYSYMVSNIESIFKAYMRMCQMILVRGTCM